MLWRKAWMPPGLGGKSLVTMRVLCIGSDSSGLPPAVGWGAYRGAGERNPAAKNTSSWPWTGSARTELGGHGAREGDEYVRAARGVDPDQNPAARLRLQDGRVPGPGR